MSIKTKLIEWYSPLPAWAKGVLIVGGSAVAVYTGYSIIKSVNNEKANRERMAKLNNFATDLNTLQANGIRPSYTQSQYQQWADSIISQFTGCDPSFPLPGCWSGSMSNSGACVYNIVANFKNDADFMAMQIAFGTQTISKHFWCGGDIKNQTLTGAIHDQLTIGEIECINKLLKEKSITIKF
jgi:hypothetical protein